MWGAPGWGDSAIWGGPGEKKRKKIAQKSFLWGPKVKNSVFEQKEGRSKSSALLTPWSKKVEKQKMRFMANLGEVIFSLIFRFRVFVKNFENFEILVPIRNGVG